MVKCIIFDLDGTLLNTSEEIHVLINRALARYGLPQITLEQTVRYIGNGAKKLAERAVPKDCRCADEVYRSFSESYARCKNERTTLYAGEKEFFDKIKKRDIKTAILTNKPQAATQSVCEKYLSPFGFDLIVGQSDRFPVKPDPASALYIAGKLGVSAEECLVVGDGETDVSTAKNAGMKSVSVLWGYRSRERLAEAGAEVFADSFDRLFQLLVDCEN